MCEIVIFRGYTTGSDVGTTTHTHPYIYITAYVAQLTKESDTQAVGHGFEPRSDH